jgi:hypothetical protein
MSPGTPDHLVIAYLHTRWALGDHRRQTHQLRRFRQHGGRVDTKRWGRLWGIAHRLAIARAEDRRVAPALVPGTQRCRWWFGRRCPEVAEPGTQLCAAHQPSSCNQLATTTATQGG